MNTEKQENTIMPKANNRKKLLIAVVVISVLIAGSAIGFMLSENNNKTIQDTSRTGTVSQSKTISPTPIKDNFYVVIKDGKFDPEKIAIPRGARVFWKNLDEKQNSVRSQALAANDPGYLPLLVSPPLDKEERYAYVFEKKGVFQYYNGLDPQVAGTVEVR